VEAVGETPKRRGPKPRGPFVGKRRTLTTKITEATRKRLEEAAAETDRSLSQEIEFRLEGSFLDEDSRNREYGGKALRALFKVLSGLTEAIEDRTGKSWDKDRDTYLGVFTAWIDIIDSWKPAASATDLKKSEKRQRESEKLLNEGKALVEAYPEPFEYPPQGVLINYTPEEESEFEDSKAQHLRDLMESNEKWEAHKRRFDEHMAQLSAEVEAAKARHDEAKEVAAMFLRHKA